MRRDILLVIFSLLTTAVLGAEAGSAQGAPGRTLYLKQTLKGHVAKSVVARTSEGQIAVYTFPKPRVYNQYDGRRYWVCKSTGNVASRREEAGHVVRSGVTAT